MDKDKIIESLEQIISDLKSGTKNGIGKGYAIRYWGNYGIHSQRPDIPDEMFYDKDESEEEVMDYIKEFHHVEMIDCETGKIHMEFHRYKDGK